MYLTILRFANLVLSGLMGLSLVLLLYKIFYHVYGLFPTKRLPAAKTQHKFAILVPARRESKVIDGLLQSLADCDYPRTHFDVYVIVEDASDPTYEICQHYDFVTCFVRPDLAVKSKGGALHQITRHIIDSGIAATKGYEAYFVFDADNTVSPHYLQEMNKVFDAGYDLGVGYRNATNWNDGWVASCSALTFSMINTFNNKGRARFTKNIMVSGTGFYIRASIIDQLGGWPFISLTEDVEASYYAALHNLKGTYNEYAEFFDEQPVSVRQSWWQRLRWVKGYGYVTSKYAHKMFGKFFTTKEQRLGKLDFALHVIPVAVPLASVIIYMLFTGILGLVGIGLWLPSTWWRSALGCSATALLGCYLFFFLYGNLMLLTEHKHTNLTFGNAVKTGLMFPFFMALYIPIVLVALCKKKVIWTKIQRKKELTNHAHE